MIYLLFLLHFFLSQLHRGRVLVRCPGAKPGKYVEMYTVSPILKVDHVGIWGEKTNSVRVKSIDATLLCFSYWACITIRGINIWHADSKAEYLLIELWIHLISSWTVIQLMTELVAPSIIVIVAQQLLAIENVIVYSIIYTLGICTQLLKTEKFTRFIIFSEKRRLLHNILLFIRYMQLHQLNSCFVWSTIVSEYKLRCKLCRILRDA